MFRIRKHRQILLVLAVRKFEEASRLFLYKLTPQHPTLANYICTLNQEKYQGADEGFLTICLDIMDLFRANDAFLGSIKDK